MKSSFPCSKPAWPNILGVDDFRTVFPIWGQTPLVVGWPVRHLFGVRVFVLLAAFLGAARIATAVEVYSELLRPQFHFTSRSNWLNDPNGLVHYGGEWHLFFQHNPKGNQWGNMTWGHAISTNLFHWKQLPDAIRQDEQGDIWSGSAVVDWNNTAGFAAGPAKALVAFYTSAGGFTPVRDKKTFDQRLAYSVDTGRSWTKSPGSPVVSQRGDGDRDPKVFWHETTKKWVMILYVGVPDEREKDAKGRPIIRHTAQLFNSPDLKSWTYLSSVADIYECPDLFELPVDGNRANTRWVLFGADGNYLLGKFDGANFVADGPKQTGDHGANFYAAQTYSDAPDGRRVLIGWMRDGKYPGMPFNQQMSLPLELSLGTTPTGIRLFRQPVKEFAQLRTGQRIELGGSPLRAGESLPLNPQTDLVQGEVRFAPGESGDVVLDVRGAEIRWSAKDCSLHAFGRKAPLAPVDGKISLNIVLDRSSIEVFANNGEVAMSFCFIPRPGDTEWRLTAVESPVRLTSWTLRRLKSVW